MQAENKKIKIGATTNIKTRLKSLRAASPSKLELLNTLKSKDIYKLELELHKKFQKKRLNGEWFNLNENDISWIKKLDVSAK